MVMSDVLFGSFYIRLLSNQVYKRKRNDAPHHCMYTAPRDDTVMAVCHIRQQLFRDSWLHHPWTLNHHNMTCLSKSMNF